MNKILQKETLKNIRNIVITRKYLQMNQILALRNEFG